MCPAYLCACNCIKHCMRTRRPLTQCAPRICAPMRFRCCGRCVPVGWRGGRRTQASCVHAARVV
eukprot:363531-Chlamydomonas_euryale.AAC.7